MLIGDVSGNGRYDIVMMQPNYMSDDRYIGHQVACLTAYSVDTGTMLWQVGNRESSSSSGSDIPAQIYDIDQDGYNEVLAVMNDQFTIIDGRTGSVEATYSLPHPEAHDTIVIANFSGNSHPRDVLLKDRYNQVWAMDSNWNLLWTFSGNPGHYPWPYDFDNDGRDELM
jgi:hypothetical protein